LNVTITSVTQLL